MRLDFYFHSKYAKTEEVGSDRAVMRKKLFLEDEDLGSELDGYQFLLLSPLNRASPPSMANFNNSHNEMKDEEEIRDIENQLNV